MLLLFYYHLDYYNSLFTGLSKISKSKLQLVQNVAILTQKMDYITSLLKMLHWLPVSFRIDFKVLLLAYKALNGLAPPYIRDLSFYVLARSLRSSTTFLLNIPHVSHKSSSEHTLCFYAPKLWNTLPLDIRTFNCFIVIIFVL